LLDGIADQLRLDVDVVKWWKASRAVTANQRLIRFFRDEIAAKTSAPVVIFLDEIDSTIALPYTDDFFVAIRAMYNDRASEPLFERITFCLVGVATPNAVSDDLAKGEAIVRAVLRWTGGHPYLTTRLCGQFLAKGGTSPDEVDEMVNKVFVSLDQLHSDVHFQQALRFLDERVENKLATLTLYRRILSGEPVRDQTTSAHIDLKLAGIVKRDHRGHLVVRNPIYTRVFTDEWAAKALEPGFDQMFECLEYCLQELPPEDRELLIRYYEGSSVERALNRRALADELGITANALSTRVHRIRAKTRNYIVSRLKKDADKF
jgi:hypothetical protein